MITLAVFWVIFFLLGDHTPVCRVLPAVLCFALLCFALLCFALLCFDLICFALLCFTPLISLHVRVFICSLAHNNSHYAESSLLGPSDDRCVPPIACSHRAPNYSPVGFMAKTPSSNGRSGRKIRSPVTADLLSQSSGLFAFFEGSHDYSSPIVSCLALPLISPHVRVSICSPSPCRVSERLA